MISLKPLKKLFKKKTLAKIGIGIGVAAAAVATGGAIMGIASGVGPAAGAAGAFGKVASSLGFGGSALAASTPGFGATQLASGGVLPAAAAQAAGTTAVSGAAPTAAATAAGAGAGAGASTAAGIGGGTAASGLSASFLPTTATPTAIPTSALGLETGSGLGQGAAAFDFGRVASGMSDLAGSAPNFSARALQSAGVAAPVGLSNVAPAARPTPSTPAAAARRDPFVAPGAVQPDAFSGYNFSGGGAGDPMTGLGSGGLGSRILGGLRSAAETGGDWWDSIGPIGQYSLLQAGSAAFSESEAEIADRLERKRIKNRRAPTYVGGGRWIG